jgi:hypothetical protein
MFNQSAKGYINIYLMLVALVLFATLASLAAVLVSDLKMVQNAQNSLMLFYLAEAGRFWGLDKLSANPSFFTDPTAQSPLKRWLVEQSMGEVNYLSKGGFKIVCPSSGKELYVVSFLGGDLLKAAGYCFLKIKFETSPFRVIKWEKF